MSDVVSHYAGAEDLTSAIRGALTNAGVDLEGISTSALAPVDEFHIRGRTATLEIAEALAVDQGSVVLDTGRGLGGQPEPLLRSSAATSRASTSRRSSARQRPNCRDGPG